MCHRLGWRVCFVASVMLIAGCGGGSDNAGKIEGTEWTSNWATVKGQMIPAHTLGLQFDKDGSLVYCAGQRQYTGKYVLNAGNQVTFNLDQPLSGEKTHVEKIVIDDPLLTMTDADGTTISFRKVRR